MRRWLGLFFVVVLVGSVWAEEVPKVALPDPPPPITQPVPPVPPTPPTVPVVTQTTPATGTTSATSTAPVVKAPPAHRFINPEKLKWMDVSSLPPGAKMALLQMPMNEEGKPFTFRMKFPPDFKIPPHFHPAIEHATVLSGMIYFGIGETFDTTKMHPVGPGGYSIMQPKTPHFAYVKEETIIQVHSIGPWGVTYVNEADDPRVPKQP